MKKPHTYHTDMYNTYLYCMYKYVHYYIEVHRSRSRRKKKEERRRRRREPSSGRKTPPYYYYDWVLFRVFFRSKFSRTNIPPIIVHPLTTNPNSNPNPSALATTRQPPSSPCPSWSWRGGAGCQILKIKFGDRGTNVLHIDISVCVLEYCQNCQNCTPYSIYSVTNNLVAPGIYVPYIQLLYMYEYPVHINQ